MKIRGISYVLMAIMVFMLVIVVLSLRMEYFASKLLPLVIAGSVFILAAIGLSREIKTGGGPRATVTKGEASSREEAGDEWHRYLLMGGWVIGLFLAIYLLGFIISIPLFILSYMKIHGTGWLTAITLAAITTAIIYGVFMLVFNVALYRGLILSLF